MFPNTPGTSDHVVTINFSIQRLLARTVTRSKGLHKLYSAVVYSVEVLTFLFRILEKY